MSGPGRKNPVAKETARILQQHFGYSAQEASSLAGTTDHDITPRSNGDEHNRNLAQQQALRNLDGRKA